MFDPPGLALVVFPESTITPTTRLPWSLDASPQTVEQDLGLFKIYGVKPLPEPIVNIGSCHASFEFLVLMLLQAVMLKQEENRLRLQKANMVRLLPYRARSSPFVNLTCVNQNLTSQASFSALRDASPSLDTDRTDAPALRLLNQLQERRARLLLIKSNMNLSAQTGRRQSYAF